MQPLRVTTGPLTGVQENGTLARLRIRRWIPCEPDNPFASTGIMPVQRNCAKAAVDVRAFSAWPFVEALEYLTCITLQIVNN